jgi:hypothetical protein
MPRFVVLGYVVLALGCEHPRADSTRDAIEAANCATVTRDTHRWLSAAELALPWPTGDAATDTEIDHAIVELRARVARTTARDLGEPRPHPDGFERLLAACPTGLARYQQPSDRDRTFVEIADRFTDCACRVSIPLFRARVYIATMVNAGRFDQLRSPSELARSRPADR